MYGSLSLRQFFESGPRIKMKLAESSLMRSPGIPMMRLTNVPPSPQSAAAFFGVLKTTTSPRDGLETVRQILQASTRSLVLAWQPGDGLAQWTYGSIDRY